MSSGSVGGGGWVPFVQLPRVARRAENDDEDEEAPPVRIHGQPWWMPRARAELAKVAAVPAPKPLRSTDDVVERLRRLVALSGSDNANEARAAEREAVRLLREQGVERLLRMPEPAQRGEDGDGGRRPAAAELAPAPALMAAPLAKARGRRIVLLERRPRIPVRARVAVAIAAAVVIAVLVGVG